MLRNKKGQYYQVPQEPFSSVHPVLIIGIVVFVIPFLAPIIGWHMPGWVSGVGVFLILLGAVLSMLKAGD